MSTLISNSNPAEGVSLSVSATDSSREVELKLKRLNKKSAETDSTEILIDGLYELFLQSGGKKRDKLSSVIAHLPQEVKFKDNFPFTQDELRLREKMKTFYGLPTSKGIQRNTGYVPVGGLPFEEEMLRQDMKGKQNAAFNDPWKKVKQAIVKHKAYRFTESEIEERLFEDGVFTVNNKRVTQATINRQYHEFLENLAVVLVPDEATVAGLQLGPSPRSYLEESPGPVIDYSQNKQKDNALPEDFGTDIVFTFLPDTLGKEGLYLDIVNRNLEKVERMYFPESTIKNNQLNIDVLKDTVLIPGYYVGYIYGRRDGKKMKRSSSSISFTIGKELFEVPGVRFVDNPKGGFLPVPLI